MGAGFWFERGRMPLLFSFFVAPVRKSMFVFDDGHSYISHFEPMHMAASLMLMLGDKVFVCL